MGLWDKVQKELDRAGTAARDALDEGKIRIDLFRVRQQADKAAQALGYAVHRAKRDSRDLDAETMERLDGGLRTHEEEARRLEGELAMAMQRDAEKSAEPAAPSDSAAPAAGTPAAAPDAPSKDA